MINEQHSQFSFFLFVNTGSGGNVGAQLLQQQVERIQFVLPPDSQLQQKPFRCNVFIYNMRTNRQEGFKRLKKQSSRSDVKSYAIVCGGDGTVMWVVTEMVKFQIPIAAVPIGVIPLGTGNDFSRQLGWGYEKSNLLQSGFKNLKRQIRKWLKAKEQYFDIWDVQAQVFENGKFQKVSGNHNETLKETIYTRSFCNYFSFGIDGKIGYSFDMHRQKSRLGNLAMYACMGIIKTMTRTKTLDQLVQSVEIVSSKRLSQNSCLQVQDCSTSSQSKFCVNEVKSSIKIKGKSSLLQSEDVKVVTYFQKDYYNILALNINSYTGGVRNIWDKAKNGFVKNINSADYQEVSTCDGKLEIVSFGSSFGIALQRMIGGFSKKFSQGEGPFIFNFHQYQKKPKHRTYLQIDGEFIRFTNPKSVILRHSSLVPKGKIKVLRNIDQKQ